MYLFKVCLFLFLCAFFFKITVRVREQWVVVMLHNVG